MSLVKLRDKRFTGIDIFGSPPNHIPELNVDVVFRLARKGAE